MHLQRLEVVDFRNHPAVALDLRPGVTVLAGLNGVGKTSLLEAVNYIASLSSHRPGPDAALVRVGAAAAVIRARVARQGRSILIDVELRPGSGVRGRVNRASVPRARDLLGVVRAVIFAPEDLALIRGDPEERRRFLDALAVQRRPGYHAARQDYERILKQRNTLLRSAGGRMPGGGGLATLEVWDEKLARAGAELWLERLRLVAALAPLVEQAYQELSAQPDHVDVAYVSSVSDDEPSPSRERDPRSAAGLGQGPAAGHGVGAARGQELEPAEEHAPEAATGRGLGAAGRGLGAAPGRGLGMAPGQDVGSTSEQELEAPGEHTIAPASEHESRLATGQQVRPAPEQDVRPAPEPEHGDSTGQQDSGSAADQQVGSGGQQTRPPTGPAGAAPGEQAGRLAAERGPGLAAEQGVGWDAALPVGSAPADELRLAAGEVGSAGQPGVWTPDSAASHPPASREASGSSRTQAVGGSGGRAEPSPGRDQTTSNPPADDKSGRIADGRISQGERGAPRPGGVTTSDASADAGGGMAPGGSASPMVRSEPSPSAHPTGSRDPGSATTEDLKKDPETRPASDSSAARPRAMIAGAEHPQGRPRPVDVNVPGSSAGSRAAVAGDSGLAVTRRAGKQAGGKAAPATGSGWGDPPSRIAAREPGRGGRSAIAGAADNPGSKAPPAPDHAEFTRRLRDRLAADRARELERGVTLSGPHRDDLAISLRGLPARTHASHGEAWSLALALRIAAYRLLASEGEEPILLLDDVFAELDHRRREQVAAIAATAEQALITLAVDEDLPSHLRGSMFHVKPGAIIPEPSR